MRANTCFLLVLIMQLFTLKSNAQTNSPDSLLLPLQPKSILIPNNYYVTPYSIQKLNNQNNNFYLNLELYSNTSSFTRELHRIILKPSKNENDNNAITIAAENEFQPFSGRIIRNIVIKRLQPFGPSVNDTTIQPSDWIQRTSNKVHTRTRISILKNQLFIKEGDKINPELLSDNERIIRSLPYIEDIHISVKPVAQNNDSVDLVLIIKDVWSVGFDAFIKNTNAGKFEFFDKNIAGTGTQLDNTISYDATQKSKIGYEGSYLISNIYNSFISAQLDVVSAFHQTTTKYALNRSFFSKNINTAGGLSFEKTTNQIIIKEIDPNYLHNLNYTKTFGWLGQKFQLPHFFNLNSPSLVIAASVLNEYFAQRPPISESSFQAYHNKTQYLGTLAFTHQNFFKTNLLNSFGKTEDIPVGSLHQLTIGVEKSQFKTRIYSELNLAHGSFIRQLGYLYLNVNLGGYHNNNTFNQSSLQIKAYTFSNLIIYGRLKMRYIATVNYMNGFNRFYDEYLTLNDTKGIRGYNDPYLIGNQKLSFNGEHNIFTPWSYLDFKMAIFGFADFGWIGRTAHSVFDNPMYSGFGCGFRIRNERLVFKTIQIRLAYYPRLSNSAAVSYFLFSSADRVTPSNFFVQPPVIHKFE